MSLFTSRPKLLPKPSLAAYLAETGHFLVRLHVFASKHIPLTMFVFFIWYSIVSYIAVPRIYSMFVPPQPVLLDTSPPTVDDSQHIISETKNVQAKVNVIPTPTEIPPDLSPIEISISKINLHAQVELVGQTKTYEMDVPKNAANVAWYVYGAKPGEEGNAVIDGHYDTPSGKPAVFYRLKTLVQNDEIEIVAQDGSRHTFIVDKVDTVAYDKFPAEYVFHTRPGKNLNLITCGGVWNPIQKNYNQRIVVYSSLKQS